MLHRRGKQRQNERKIKNNRPNQSGEIRRGTGILQKPLFVNKLLDPILLHLVVEGLAGDTQKTGGLFVVPVCSCEGPHDQFPFYLLGCLAGNLGKREILVDRNGDLPGCSAPGRVPDLGRKVGNIDGAVGHHHRSLDDVPKLADIPLEGIFHEFLQGLRRNTRDLFSHFTLQLNNKFLTQERDVFPSFTQGGEEDRKLVQPVKQIESETSVPLSGRFFGQIRVCRGDDPYQRVDRFSAPKPFELPGFQKAEEF